MSHHSSEPDPKLTAEFEKLFTEKLGPTGKYPNGRVLPTDEGETKMAVTNKNGVVIIDFGKPVAWVGFTATEIRGLIEVLTKHADVIDPR